MDDTGCKPDSDSSPHDRPKRGSAACSKRPKSKSGSALTAARVRRDKPWLGAGAEQTAKRSEARLPRWVALAPARRASWPRGPIKMPIFAGRA